MREIARARGVHASTVMRGIRRVEDLRSKPAWDRLLDELEAAGASDGPQVLSVVQARLESLSPGSIVERTRSTLESRPLAERLEEPVPTFTLAGRIRLMNEQERLGYSDVVAGSDPASEVMKSLWIMTRPARNGPARLTPGLVRTAGRVQGMFARADRDGEGSEAFRDLVRLKHRLGEQLTSVLYYRLHRHVGLEDIERRLEWPARSAKIVLQIALEQARREVGE